MKDADIVFVSLLSILLLKLLLFLSESIHSSWYGRHLIIRRPGFLRDCTLLSDDASLLGATCVLTPHIRSVLFVKNYGVGLYVYGTCRVHVL